MLKKVAFITVFFLSSFTLAYAQVGMGIFPARIEIESPFLKNTFTDIVIFNPSQKEVNIRIEFYCKNCERDVKFFGNKIGTLTYDLETKIIPEKISLKPGMEQRVLVKFPNSLFLKGIFQTEIFGEKVNIPFYSLHFDEEKLECRVVATTISPTEISLISDISLKFFGISKVFFILTILVLLFIASSFFYLYTKKIYKKYEKF